MTSHIVPYRPGHYREITRKLSPFVGIASADAAVLYSKSGAAYTGLVGGEIAGCAGVLVPWPGVGEAWAILTDVGRAHPLFVHRVVKRTLYEIVAHEKLRRVQADVVAAFDAGRRWVERLGFEFESFMQRYGPNGEDFTRYRILP